MGRLHTLLLIIVLLMTSQMSFAQKIFVSGKVSDGSNGDPIIGGTIVEQDKDQRILSGTVTDVNGNFTFEVSGPDIFLVFSSIGYKSQSIELKGRKSLSIVLESNYIQLEGAQIVAERGYSDPLTNISERDRTGSSVKLDLDASTTAGITSVEDAMQGKLSGVEIVGGGDPGSGGSIVIRGLGTLGNSSPLIVLDGIPQDVKTGGDFDFSTADAEDIGLLVSIAPQDIRTIEVLKDASSTAIWGTKGANGVIQIETKRGSIGKTKFTYQSKLIQTSPREAIPLLNGDEYIMLQLEELQAPTGIYNLPNELSGDRKLLGDDYHNYTQNTDWVDAITKKGYGTDHYLQLNGGGQKTNYFGSINYLNETGNTINTGYKRISSRINFNYKISNKLSLESRISYTNSLKEDNYTSSSSSSNIRSMALKKSPNMSIYNMNSNGTASNEFFTPITSYQGSGRSYYNPVSMGMLSADDEEQNRIESTFSLKYNILPWLRYTGTMSYTYLNSKRNRFLPSNAIGVDWLDDDNNYARELDESVNRILTRNQVFITPYINASHKLSAVIMLETNAETAEYISLNNSRTASIFLQDPSVAGPFRSYNSSGSIDRSIGGLAQVFYSFKDKYMITLNSRVDGVSCLGRESRWGVFPSASVGWRFSDEPFLKQFSFLNDSKLRLSYGLTGNLGNIKEYSRHATYGTISNLPNQYYTHSALFPESIQLDKVQWETVKQWNLGLDLALFQRFNLSVEVYDKLTTDIIWKNYDIPSSSGYGDLDFFNGGKVRNQGWEILFNLTAIKTKDYTVKVNFNLTHNVNKYIEFPDNFNPEQSVSLGNGEYPRRANVGEAIGSFYGLEWLGVYSDEESVVARNADNEIIYDVRGMPLKPKYASGFEFGPGDAIYADQNSDGVIDILDVVYLGDANPEFEGGFGFFFSYKKRFTASFNFHGRYGFEIVNQIANETQGMSDRNNQSIAVINRWRKPGDDFPGILPRAYFGHPANSLGSDRFVEDGSFLRFNSMTIKYSIPRNWSKKIGIDNFDIAWTMRKIYTWTNYTGQDPEIKRSADPFWMGADEGKTPVPLTSNLSLIVNI